MANPEVEVKAVKEPVMDLKLLAYQAEVSSVRNGLPGTTAIKGRMAHNS